MVVEGYEFEHVTDLAPVRTADGVIHALMPQGRYANARGLPLNSYGAGPFCKFTVPAGYRKSGVYLLVAGRTFDMWASAPTCPPGSIRGMGTYRPRTVTRAGRRRIAGSTTSCIGQFSMVRRYPCSSTQRPITKRLRQGLGRFCAPLGTGSRRASGPFAARVSSETGWSTGHRWPQSAYRAKGSRPRWRP